MHCYLTCCCNNVLVPHTESGSHSLSMERLAVETRFCLKCMCIATVAIISNVKVALHVTGDKLHVDPQSMQKTAQHIPRDCASQFEITSFSFLATKCTENRRSTEAH